MEFKIPKHLSEKSGIYVIASLIDKRKYFGSAKNLLSRWRSHVKTAKSGKHGNTHIRNFVAKYGAKNLEFNLVEIVDCVSDLLVREQVYLDYVFSLPDEERFNICPIAGNTLGVKPSPETRKKMSESRMGEKNYLYGKKLPPEMKLNISRKNGRRILAQNLLSGEKIEFLSTLDASKTLLLDYAKIRKAALKKRNYGGYKFSYLGKIRCKAAHRPVVKYSINGAFIKKYESAYDAEAEGFMVSRIYNVCKNRNRIHGGFHWKFYHSESDLQDKPFIKDTCAKRRHPFEKPVVQLTKDGQFIARFKSSREASLITGLEYRYIRAACLGKKMKTYKGYKWSFITE